MGSIPYKWCESRERRGGRDGKEKLGEDGKIKRGERLSGVTVGAVVNDIANVVIYVVILLLLLSMLLMMLVLLMFLLLLVILQFVLLPLLKLIYTHGESTVTGDNVVKAMVMWLLLMML